MPDIGRRNAVLYSQPGLRADKQALIKSMARGFDHVTGNVGDLRHLPVDMVPVVGCQMELRDIEEEWLRSGRTFVYWDRGYLGRGGKTWIRRKGPEYFRWHVNSYQMNALRPDASAERFERLNLHALPWRRSAGKKVIIAAPSRHYAEFHRIGGWTGWAKAEVARRGYQPVIREKDSASPLQRDLEDAYCLLTHGSVAAVEAVLLGCPVIVAPISAAAPVARTSIEDIDDLAFPDRGPWLASIACSQFTADEVASGAIWGML